LQRESRIARAPTASMLATGPGPFYGLGLTRAAPDEGRATPRRSAVCEPLDLLAAIAGREHDAVAAAFLRLVERTVSGDQQVRQLVAVVGRTGDPDRH